MTHISTVGRVYKGHHIGPDHGPDHVSTRARPCCSSTEDGQFHDVKRPTTIGHVMGIMCLTQCHLHHPQVITIFTGCIKHSQMVAIYAIGWIPHGNEWDMTNLLFDRQAFQINGYEWGSISPAMGYKPPCHVDLYPLYVINYVKSYYIISYSMSYYMFGYIYIYK